MGSKRHPLLDDFCRHLADTPSEADLCWEWNGRFDGDAYPIVWVKSKRTNVQARRVAYEIRHGEGSLMPFMQLDMICGRRCCVRVDHMKVIVGKVGRRRKNGLLTQAMVDEAQLRRSDGQSASQISRELGITRPRLRRIFAGRGVRLTSSENGS